MAVKYVQIMAQREPLFLGLLTIGASECGISLTIIGVVNGSRDHLLESEESGLKST